MSDELEEYRSQLAVVEEGLAEDPENATLLDLKKELVDLIGLLDEQKDSDGESASKEESKATTPIEEDNRAKSASSEPRLENDGQRSQSPPQSTSTPPPPQQKLNINRVRFKAGDMVLAQWLSGDKQYYQAKVTSVTGSMSNPRYTVKFPKHNTTETLPADSVRQMPATHVNKKPTIPPKTGPIDKVSKSDNQAPKKVQHQPSKAQILDSGKQKWQQFTKKGLKQGKGMKAKKLGETSMFRSPDDPLAKVGVVGSGRGMTKEKPRTKHVFDSSSRIE
jgi:survival-of-motor-neuron-related-splicing factor 30